MTVVIMGRTITFPLNGEMFKVSRVRIPSEWEYEFRTIKIHTLHCVSPISHPLRMNIENGITSTQAICESTEET